MGDLSIKIDKVPCSTNTAFLLSLIKILTICVKSIPRLISSCDKYQDCETVTRESLSP